MFLTCSAYALIGVGLHSFLGYLNRPATLRSKKGLPCQSSETFALSLPEPTPLPSDSTCSPLSAHYDHDRSRSSTARWPTFLYLMPGALTSWDYSLYSRHLDRWKMYLHGQSVNDSKCSESLQVVLQVACFSRLGWSSLVLSDGYVVYDTAL